MSRAEDHPLRRMAETLLHDYERFTEYCRRHHEQYEAMQYIPFPTQAEAQKAARLLRRQRAYIGQLVDLLEEQFTLTHKLLQGVMDKQEAWEDQMRVWREGLDEELRQLNREWDSRSE
jgi:hypothetical protein